MEPKDVWSVGSSAVRHERVGAGAGDGRQSDRATDRSELAIVDAQTLQDVASIKLPHRVPAGFHGNWVPTPAA